MIWVGKMSLKMTKISDEVEELSDSLSKEIESDFRKRIAEGFFQLYAKLRERHPDFPTGILQTYIEHYIWNIGIHINYESILHLQQLIQEAD